MYALRSPQFLGILAACAGVFLGACGDSEPPRSSTVKEESKLPKTIPGLTPEPKPSAGGPPLSITFTQEQDEGNPLPRTGASPGTSQQNLAPEGVFFVTEHISIVHDSGVLGVSPGTKVRLIKQNGQLMLVSDGKNQFEVGPDQVTRDTVLAQKLLNLDQAAQSTLAGAQDRQKNALAEQQEQRRRAFEREVGAILEEKEAKKQAQADTDTTRPKYESPLERGAYNQSRAWRYDIYGRAYWIDSSGRRYYYYRYAR